MYGLIDCNNFYASCERVFRPDLRNTPIVVLSNNDGCVIARSNEVKLLGIEMGVPAYQIKRKIEKYGVAVFSSNYMLYGDMSTRVMKALNKFVEEVTVYSIDEAFLDLFGYELFNLKDYGKEIVRNISKGTGIPVSLGIAPTKTLAKIASKFAKKYKGYQGSCIIDSDEKRIKALQSTAIADVWGIGDEYTKFLTRYNIRTAYDFTQLPRAFVRKNMTIVGEKTWCELLGESCIKVESFNVPKKNICTSRAFGTMISDFEGLREAISNFAALCATKLRKQHSCATSLMVFIHTNNFREDLPQYYKNIIVDLPFPTNVTNEVVHYAIEGLKRIYKPNFAFKKAGVIVMEVIPDNHIQQNFFDEYKEKRDRFSKLMPIADKYNNGFNRNLLTLASQIGNKDWKMKQIHRSPCYSTRFEDTIRIKLK